MTVWISHSNVIGSWATFGSWFDASLPLHLYPPNAHPWGQSGPRRKSRDRHGGGRDRKLRVTDGQFVTCPLYQAAV